ncbi:hypothetical protein [Thalassospira marina]|uniref:Uncharacterized protein n=1 Tax=Thalassospira marina TaxID=2048283 RepID=A0A2N3KSM5_9PROT|nr:hypothetical protein [Thalassospira marina]PKR53520.1 hypothetical protein COO20_13350 [Thalassospira marina]
MPGDLEVRVSRIEEAARGFLLVAEQIHILTNTQTQLIERLVRVEEQRANDRQEFDRVRNKVDAHNTFVTRAGPALSKVLTFVLGVGSALVTGFLLAHFRGGA